MKMKLLCTKNTNIVTVYITLYNHIDYMYTLWIIVLHSIQFTHVIHNNNQEIITQLPMIQQLTLQTLRHLIAKAHYN